MNRKITVTSFALHVMAMAFMLCDHLGATLIRTNSDWMTMVGRLAFPIFAFMVVEGFFRTKSRKKYALRLAVFALLSEIPFNLMMGGSYVYPFHQNVLWSFLLCVGLMAINERAKEKGKGWLLLSAFGTFLLGTLVGMISAIDYMHYGVWMVLAFYFLRGDRWWNYVAQGVALFLINNEVGGIAYEWQFLGRSLFVSKQWFAVLGLIPIWLYKGEQGHHSKAFQYICYAFYPVHMLIIGLCVRYL